MTQGTAATWAGITVIFLLASLTMVQLRCRVTGGYPCGDWPKDGYTWHFWPVFLGLCFFWLVGAWVWSRGRGRSLAEGFDAYGNAASPMLGLTLTWSWYGLSGPQFHPPKCGIPVLCHDVLPGSMALWALPWIVWAAARLISLWRKPAG
jgi:hypothetical protein